MNSSDIFRRHIETQLRHRAAAIESALEGALQGGEHGVLVDEEACTATVSVLVPYGRVYLVGVVRLDSPGWPCDGNCGAP